MHILLRKEEGDYTITRLHITPTLLKSERNLMPIINM
jgi:hypothetical protein